MALYKYFSFHFSFTASCNWSSPYQSASRAVRSPHSCDLGSLGSAWRHWDHVTWEPIRSLMLRVRFIVGNRCSTSLEPQWPVRRASSISRRLYVTLTLRCTAWTEGHCEQLLTTPDECQFGQPRTMTYRKDVSSCITSRWLRSIGIMLCTAYIGVDFRKLIMRVRSFPLSSLPPSLLFLPYLPSFLSTPLSSPFFYSHFSPVPPSASAVYRT